MTEQLGTWIRQLVGTAMLVGAAQALCPKGRVRDVLRVIGGVVMALALVSPIAELDMDAYAAALVRDGMTEQEVTAMAEGAYDTLTKAVIEEKSAAYILDRAQALGVSAQEASVTARQDGDGVWYPYEAAITAEKSAGLADTIEAELGIPASRQYWSENED
jgi:stage III sporulation protein AF